ncbi:MAG: class I SAM-dependent methyltransferase [Actinomycetota bacterium]
MVATPSPEAEQLAYYRAVAGEYHEHTIDVPGQAELLAAIDAFSPVGDVLELACGSGLWTERLARTAATVTAVDGAPEMLALARRRVDAPTVDFVEADLFDWQAARRYDAVFFGFWISHVPEDRFAAFWSMVADALAPGGRVFFFDDNHRPDAELIEGSASPIVERRLLDGTAFRVVKISYQADELEARLRGLGWDIDVRPTPGPFYWGTGGR